MKADGSATTDSSISYRIPLQDLVHSELFLHADCRQVILPVLCSGIDVVLCKPGASLALNATKALGDCLDKLFNAELYQVRQLLLTLVTC